MKKLFTLGLITVLCCMTVAITIGFGTQPSFAISIAATANYQSNPFMDKLEADILPQLEEILSPEQQTALNAALETSNLRKALEAATLTTEQKEQVDALVKASLTNKFNALSPTEKRDFFVNQKADFLKDKNPFMPDLNAISEKKKAFMPDFKAIAEKKKALMPDLETIIQQKQEP